MGGKEGSLTISVREMTNNKIQILINDTGKGMTAKMRYQVFEPGYTTKKRG